MQEFSIGQVVPSVEPTGLDNTAHQLSLMNCGSEMCQAVVSQLEIPVFISARSNTLSAYQEKLYLLGISSTFGHHMSNGHLGV